MQSDGDKSFRIISLGLIGIIIKNRKEENNGKGFGRKEI